MTNFDVDYNEGLTTFVDDKGYISILGSDGVVHSEIGAMESFEMMIDLRRYLSDAPTDTQIQGIQAIDKMIKQKRSPLYIWCSITNNTVEDLAKYGFGSCFSKKTEQRIKQKVEAELIDRYVNNPWDWIGDRLLPDGLPPEDVWEQGITDTDFWGQGDEIVF